MKRQTIFLMTALFLLTGTSLKAQSFHIKGEVADSKQEAIAGASVQLYSEKDTLHAISAVVTNNKGHFAFAKLPAGDYHIRTSFIGYKGSSLQIDNLSSNINGLKIVLHEESIQLDEATVTTSRIVTEFDRQIIYPDQYTKKRSVNGIDFIDALHLSGIIVDNSEDPIKGIQGGTILLRINGAPADVNDIQNIDPEMVTRVEYHDMPSMRYGNAEGVIDLYVKRKEFGGTGSIYSDNNLTSLNSRQGGYLKFSNRKSEFSVSGSFSTRYNREGTIEKLTDYHFENGDILTRHEVLTGKSKKNEGNGALNYNYLIPDDKMFQVKFSYYGLPKFYEDFGGPIMENDKLQLEKRLYHDNNMKMPRVNLYYQQNLKNKQFIAIDVMGSYTRGKENLNTQETLGQNITTNISNLINAKTYTIAAEGIYEKRFENMSLSSGLNQRINYVDNQYGGSMDNLSRIHNYTTNVYAELMGKKGKLNYSVGARGIFNQVYQNNEHNNSASFGGNLRAGYQFTKASQLRYNGSMTVTLPTLGSMNDVEMDMNGYESKKGNAGLDKMTTYSNTLNYIFQKGQFRYNLNAGSTYTVHPTLATISRENGRFVSQTRNGDYLHNLTASAMINWNSTNRKIGLFSRIMYIHTENKITEYFHSLNTWSFNIGGSWDCNEHLSFMGGFYKGKKSLSSENISYPSQNINCRIVYRWKDLFIWANAEFRIGNKANRTENLNQYVYSDQKITLPESNTYIRLQVSWNFQFGKPRKSMRTRIENAATSNTSFQ